MSFPLKEKEPYLFQLPASIKDPTGNLFSTQAAHELPFPVRRIFWIAGPATPIERGNHAHRQTEEILITLQGNVTVETVTENSQSFLMQDPAMALYVPALCWVKITYEPNSILLALASTDYTADDYIWEYSLFQELRRSGG